MFVGVKMPIYDFKCDECGDITEEFTSSDSLSDFRVCFKILETFEEDGVVWHTNCPGIKKVVLSAPAVIQVKGEGAYNNDMVCRGKKNE